jgi:hypothetical protein
LFEAPSPEWRANAGIGAFIALNFGRKTSMEWGFEAFGNAVYDSGGGCSADPRSAIGPLAQIAWLGLKEPRLTLAVHGGREMEREKGIVGELGLTARFLDQVRYGVHTGVLLDASYANVFARQEWLINDYSIGAGIRVLPTFGAPGSCNVGRLLRDAQGSQIHLPRAKPTKFAVCAEDAELGFTWIDNMQHEHASVFAFLQLAFELEAVSAPPELIDRALAAAEDEVLHTALCATLARRHLGVNDAAIAPSTPDDWTRPVLDRPLALQRLATESLLDGCLNEGAAASEARFGALHARDPQARAIQSQIARDEERHTELAWDILTWALSIGGSATLEATRLAWASSPRSIECRGIAGRLDHGQLSDDERMLVRDHTYRKVRARLVTLNVAA